MQTKKSWYSLIKNSKLPMEKISHFINGKKFSVKDSRKAAIFNPALGEQIAEVELASRETVNLATESAAKAFLDWS